MTDRTGRVSSKSTSPRSSTFRSSPAASPTTDSLFSSPTSSSQAKSSLGHGTTLSSQSIASSGSQYSTSPLSSRLLRNRRETLSQAIDYATSLCLGTSRTCSFLLIVTGRIVNFTRWDHGTTAVTRPIDIFKETNVFIALLHAFAHSTRSMRGLDVTIDPVENALRARVIKKADTLLRTLGPSYSEHVKIFQSQPLHRIQVPDATHAGRFLTCVFARKPTFSSTSIIGRFTQCHVVFIEDTDSFGIYKKIWRVNEDDVWPEHVIYDRLRRGQIVGVPTVIGAGNTYRPDQLNGDDKWHRTLDQHVREWSCGWELWGPSRSIRPMVQYGLLMDEPCVPLDNLATLYEVVHTLYGALCGSFYFVLDLEP
jgi:hypothetical protein